MKLSIAHNVPLADLTTFHIGGEAKEFVEVRSESELSEAIEYAKSNDLPVVILGGGSNVLVSDKGVTGLVVKISILGIGVVEKTDSVLVRAGAGEVFDSLVRQTVEAGWWGLENLSSIPGLVGATPVQNVGAYGVEVADLIDEVKVYDLKDSVYKILTAAECDFGYRDSLFKKTSGRYIVTEVVYRLKKVGDPNIKYADLKNLFGDDNPTLLQVREAVITIRSKKFPDWSMVGTAGSFFKNPIIEKSLAEALSRKYETMPMYDTENGLVKIPLGFVLDKVLHLKGYENDKVSTFKNQALVIVAKRGAKASEVEVFANDIADRVLVETGISIEWEVTKIS
ncbi:UDP-N-acetylmuramate dehydrogenase [Candidatus Kaiserbacteria bacterium]|nr:UDP-N-acetylmuramate dehydrogenase [Candidatus Kaiserbacteria bacterium]